MLKSEIATQLHQHIQSFLDYCRTRCMADGTIEGYGNNLRQFAELLGALPGSKTLTDFKEACTESILLETVVVRQGSNPDLSAHTIRRYISAWRSWVRYLVKIDVLDIAYDRFKFDLPKLPETLPKAVDMPILDKILDTPSIRRQPQWMYLRNICMFELMTYSGLRVSEVTSLTLSDLYFSQKQVRVTGKGNKTRLVPVTECVIERIREYLQARNTSLVKIKVDYLFTSRYGDKLTTCTVRQHLHNLANELLKDKFRLTPHMLRHSCATHFIRQTHDLRFVQILLGHSSVATTQMYTHLDNDFVKATFYQHLTGSRISKPS